MELMFCKLKDKPVWILPMKSRNLKRRKLWIENKMRLIWQFNNNFQMKSLSVTIKRMMSPMKVKEMKKKPLRFNLNQITKRKLLSFKSKLKNQFSRKMENEILSIEKLRIKTFNLWLLIIIWQVKFLLFLWCHKCNKWLELCPIIWPIWIQWWWHKCFSNFVIP